MLCCLGKGDADVGGKGEEFSKLREFSEGTGVSLREVLSERERISSGERRALEGRCGLRCGLQLRNTKNWLKECTSVNPGSAIT